MVSDLEIRVASLRFLSKKNNLFTVRLENGSEYSVHSDFVVKYKIKKNSLIKKSVLNVALNRTERRLIKNKIIVLLSYRIRSKHELIELFLASGFLLVNINNVINDLEKREYLNDYEFAKMYASHLVKEKKLGQFLVEQKLKQHKIDSETIVEVVSKLYKEFPTVNIIKEIIKKKKHLLGKSEKDKLKLTNYLKRKGFQFEEIISVMKSNHPIF